MRHATLCITSLVCLGATPARAADWTSSFEAKAVGTYLEGDRPAVIVVGAGHGRDPTAAAAALREALRASGRASLVMDDAALGAVRTLDDQSIVKRAAGFPARVIAVVRVFPGGSADTGVVTFYDRQGKTLAALSATIGEVVAPRRTSSGQGVTREAATAVDEVLKTESGARRDEPTDAEREYQRRHVGFEKVAVLSVYSSYSATLSGQWGVPYVGDRSSVLDAPDFFREVGRPDYANFYVRRTRTKRALSIPGWLLGLGGAAMLTAGALHAIPEHCRAQDHSYNCLDSDSTSNHLLLGFGVALTAVGLVGIITSAAINRMPTTVDENHRLAAAHNKRLRQQLGLPARLDDDVPADAQRAAGAPTGPALRVQSMASTRGGGLALRIDY